MTGADARLNDMATKAVTKDSEADEEQIGLPSTLHVNMRALIESVAGRLSDDEIDQWFVAMAKANEGRGFYLELTGEGELAINPMVNADSGYAEGQLSGVLFIWVEANGGFSFSPRTIVRLPDGGRAEPDATWLSPEQVERLLPLGMNRAITECPAFVAEIVSGSDRLLSLRRKMERYIANGALLGWLIDPYRRRVWVYRPGVEAEDLDDPETITGDPVMPGFVFEVRRRVFDIHQTV